MPAQNDLILLHKWANDQFIVDIAVLFITTLTFFEVVKTIHIFNVQGQNGLITLQWVHDIVKVVGVGENFTIS